MFHIEVGPSHELDVHGRPFACMVRTPANGAVTARLENGSWSGRVWRGDGERGQDGQRSDEDSLEHDGMRCRQLLRRREER